MSQDKDEKLSFLAKIIRFHDRQMSEEDLAVFNQQLREDEEKRNQFIEYFQFSQQVRDSYALSKASGKPQAHPLSEGLKSSKLPQWALAAAAAITFFIGILFWNQIDRSPQGFAAISQTVGARWENGEKVSPQQIVEPQSFKLERGLIRMDFENGARVGIEGPADFEIIDAMRIKLHHGVLTADIPETAHGFSIDTADAEIIDIGTAFGVSVQQNTGTEVSVFQGEVEINTEQMLASRLLEQGQSVRATRDQAGLQDLLYQTMPFQNAWPVTSGVLQTTGSLRFVAPDPTFVPGRYEDDEYILVFPERRKFQIEEAIKIDYSEPGEYFRWHRTEENVLEPGAYVRSYLLQLDPQGRRPKGIESQERVFGQITFDHPILGIIASNDRLKQSDAVLGHPDGIYRFAPSRGLEPRRKKEHQHEGKDTLILAADQRTLILDLRAGTSIDQIRVIVDENP